MNTRRLPSDQFLARIASEEKFPVTPSATGMPPSRAHAAAILARHGGSHVGEVGSGLSAARSDVEFYRAPYLDADEYVEEWVALLGPLTAFADAHHGHEILYVDAAGTCYAYTVPDGRLYPLGEDFGEAMACLLLGKRPGPAIPGSGVD